jgi:GNAT superfamily N-acetyltransferase
VSSLIPHVDWSAAKLHSRRFEKAAVISAITLASADEIVTDSSGGVACLTFGYNPFRWATLCAFAYGGSLVGLAVGPWPVRVVSIPLFAYALVFLAPRFERHWRARRNFGPARTTWIVSDVATEPGRRIGDRLLIEITRRADDVGRVLVLVVKPENSAAVRLYGTHGFERVGSRGSVVVMARGDQPGGPRYG